MNFFWNTHELNIQKVLIPKNCIRVAAFVFYLITFGIGGMNISFIANDKKNVELIKSTIPHNFILKYCNPVAP